MSNPYLPPNYSDARLDREYGSDEDEQESN